MADPISAMAGELIHDDPELRAAVKNLAMRAVQEAQIIMDRGTPNLKLSVIKVLMPAVARELAKKEERDDLAILRAQMTEMFKEIRDGVPGEDGDAASGTAS
jgi:hypothetical protein